MGRRSFPETWIFAVGASRRLFGGRAETTAAHDRNHSAAGHDFRSRGPSAGDERASEIGVCGAGGSCRPVDGGASAVGHRECAGRCAATTASVLEVVRMDQPEAPAGKGGSDYGAESARNLFPG